MTSRQQAQNSEAPSDSENTGNDMQSNSTELWERLPRESEKAFAAARLYLQMGEQRSLKKVAQEKRKGLALIKRWSIKYQWRQRADAYDNDLDRLIQQKQQEQATADALRWAERDEARQEENYQLSKAIKDKVTLGLKMPLTTAEADKDGTRTTIRPTKWTLGTLSNMLQTALKLDETWRAKAIHSEEMDVFDDFVPYKSTKP